MRFKTPGIPMIFAAFLLAGSLSAQVIVNPGFEANSTYSTFNSGDTFNGWTVSTPGFVGLPLSSLGTPHQGSQVLVPAFTSSSGTTTVAQTLSGLTPGQLYTLSFYTSAYSSTTYFGTSSATVSLGSASTSFSYTIPAENRTFGSASSPWVLRSFTYTPLSTSALLSISVTHGTTDPYIGFDSFAIVPEPSSYALLGLGVLALVASRLRARFGRLQRKRARQLALN